MPRKKKNAENIEVSENPISEVDVEYALRFAREYMGYNPQLYPYGVYSPMMTNSRMKELSYLGQSGTSEEIEKALANPNSSEDQLLSYGQNLETQSMLFKRILHYFSRMLSFDLNYVVSGVGGKDIDYKSKEFKKDKSKMMEFFDRFDYVNEFQKIMDVLVREEVFFGCYRGDTGEEFGIQQLPSKYCLITGRAPGRILYDFNLIFFTNAGIDINLFHPMLKEYYMKVFGGQKNPSQYIPSADLDKRDGSWAYYVQTDPSIFWAFKLFEQMATRIPLFAGMYPDLVLQPLFRNLAKTSAMASAVNILKGEVGTNNNSTKGGSLANNFNIDAQNLGRFMQLLRSSVNEVINVTAAPLTQLSTANYPLPDRNVYDESMMVTASSSGVESRLIYGRDRKSIFESEQSIGLDANLISPIYQEFQKFLNFKVNEYVGSRKYKFKILLSGTKLPFAMKKKMSDFTTMANIGIFNPTLAAASMEMNRFDLERMLEQNKAEGWTDMLTPIVPAFQQSADGSGQSGKGRPQKEVEELGESGMDTLDAGSNSEKSGNV